MRPNWPRIGGLVLTLVVALGLIWGAAVVWSNLTKQPLPLDDQCQAVAGTDTVTVTPEQARNASIIAAVALRRGLPPRAASIALATAYQESGLRNLDYGHADSIGLFQQRPSKGWGSVAQIMDPFYSAARFYQALVRVKGWQNGDINDVAQAVQRSAHPEAYRKHVAKARVLASALTGETPAAFTCRAGSLGRPDAAGVEALLARALAGVTRPELTGGRVQLSTPDDGFAWAAANLAVAHSSERGVVRVQLGDRDWVHAAGELASWTGTGGGRTVTISFRG